MNTVIHSHDPITAIGGGDVDFESLEQALSLAPCLVAADGGARAALAAGHAPEAVIGDLDSLEPSVRAQLDPETVHHLAEQDSTDFDKLRRSVEAPLILGVGFLGRRLDHSIAVLSSLVSKPAPPTILLGPWDVVFHLNASVTLDLPAGSRVSLFPMREVQGRSSGLHWPIHGVPFAPDSRIGTSNKASGDGPVILEMDGPGMLVMLSRDAFSAVWDSFAAPLGKRRNR